jgi:hypothetical protein
VPEDGSKRLRHNWNACMPEQGCPPVFNSEIPAYLNLKYLL